MADLLASPLFYIGIPIIGIVVAILLGGGVIYYTRLALRDVNSMDERIDALITEKYDLITEKYDLITEKYDLMRQHAISESDNHRRLSAALIENIRLKQELRELGVDDNDNPQSNRFNSGGSRNPEYDPK